MQKKAESTRQANLAKNISNFRHDHSDLVQWMVSNAESFDFARSLLEQLNQRGTLSINQMEAIRKCIAKAAARNVINTAKREAAVMDVSGASNIEVAFERARSNHIKRPKMRFDGVVFSRAPDSGRNSGCIYVVVNDTYAGRIAEGKFLPTNYGSKADIQAKLMPVFANPLSEAVAYGRKEGVCSCCGRRLDNAESIELGIGPICREKYF